MAAIKAIPAGLILACLPAPCLALERCAPRDDMLAELEKQYQERVVATAMIQERAVEITAADNGSWTLLITDPDTSVSCAIAAGQKWSALKANWGLRI